MAMVLQATGSRAAVAIISLMFSDCFINGSNASITSASRLLYAMACDRGIGFHKFFSHAHPRLNVPVRAVAFCHVFNACLGPLYLGPSAAFSAYVASCTILLNLSYAAPIVVLISHGRAILSEHQSPSTPFKMRSYWGQVVNIVAAIYIAVTFVVR